MAKAEQTVYVRASKAQVRQILRDLPALCTGGKSGASAVARVLFVRMGLAALDKIRTAFVTKARGGTDEAGERWAPLSPLTIAYSRRHRTGKKWTSKKIRGGVRPSAALTKAQQAQWWSHYKNFLGRYRGNKAHAAAAAWISIKAAGATTLMQRYGQTQVEILRDTGLLLNSLTPGAPADTAPSSPPRKPHQVFRTGRGEVIIGTSREWAGTHHNGVPGRIPQRRLWPRPGQWPASWWQSILEQGRQGLIDVLLYALGKR